MTLVAFCHDASNERYEELESENKLARAQLRLYVMLRIRRQTAAGISMM